MYQIRVFCSSLLGWVGLGANLLHRINKSQKIHDESNVYAEAQLVLFGAECVLSSDFKSNHLLYNNIISRILGP